MKILHIVQNYSPSVGGMQEVVKQLSERLATFGHDITIATSFHPERSFYNLNNIKIEQFKIDGNFTNGYLGDKLEIERYKKFITNDSFEIVVNFAAQHWATDICFELLDKIQGKKVFVPTGFSRLHDPRYKKYFNLIPTWAKKHDINIMLSETYQDAVLLKNNHVNNLTLIPNGADEKEFLNSSRSDLREKLNIHPDSFLILHVGTHTGEKGHSEAIAIFNKANIKKSTLLIVGNDFNDGCQNSCLNQANNFNNDLNNKKNGKNIIVTTLPRQDTVNAYKCSDLFLFPSNLECSPIVLFECMAARLPFLTTDVGNSEEIIGWSQAGLLLPTKKTFYINKPISSLIKIIIKKIISLDFLNYKINKNYSKAIINNSAILLEKIYQNKGFRQELGNNGFNAWQKKFTWDKIAKDYETIYANLLKNKN